MKHILADPKYYESLSKEHRDFLLEGAAFYEKQLEKHKADGPSVVASIMKMIDKEYEEKIAPHAVCKNGCNHCCHLQVEMTAPEARLAFDYAKEKGIEIDEAQLDRQIPFEKVSGAEWTRKLPIHHRKCVFLKNGSCAVYEYRPLVCRKYNSISDPKNCDTTKGASKVGRTYWWNIEAMTIAINSLYADTIGGLPRHLKDLVNGKEHERSNF